MEMLFPVGTVKGSKCVVASEKVAKDMAKQIERDLGKEARRLFHDLENVADRSLEELKEDARYIYQQADKLWKLPTWMK